MSSVIKRKQSPYWYISKKIAGRWKVISTRYRTDDPTATAKAKAEAAMASVEENLGVRHASSEWVAGCIERMPVCDLTRLRYREAWYVLSLYMFEASVTLDAFDVAHANLFIEWRMSRKPKNKYIFPCRNTALQELKILKIIQKQARLLGKMSVRPMDDFVMRASPRKIKPALTDEQIKKIRERLPDCAPWMSIAFEIALATGCRLSETSIPMDCIDLKNNTMTFPCPKGGASKSFSIPIPTSILPLLTRLAQSKVPRTCFLPTNDSKPFRVLFDRLGYKDICFHSLRVTRVTRLRQSGVSARDAMRLVNHSSELVHKLYDRHDVSELRGLVDVGSVPAAKGQNLMVSRLLRPTGIPAVPPAV